MSGKRKYDLPVYLLTCSQCGATANGNSREVDGWTISPVTLCSCCNGSKEDSYLPQPAKEKGKFIRIPYNPK